ncbi:MAG: tryptophan synthase subunit alpha [Candidatus Aminicenantaceae bacterium]
MSKIEARFSDLLSQGKKAFIPFMTACYPSREKFREFLLRADDANADYIEIGIPFSDPLADGKTIQYSSQWVLKNGFLYSQLLEDLYCLKEKLDASLILMPYFNYILQKGLDKFSVEMREANIEGVIVPDLVLEESYPTRKMLAKKGIDLIYLVSPSTCCERIESIDKVSNGFIYLVSLTGVTGVRGTLSDKLAAYIQRTRKTTSKPLCVGFGISNSFQARKVAELSDGVIIGSAIIDIIRGKEMEKNIIKKVGTFLMELRQAI